MLKTFLQNIAHFPTLRMGFYFLVEKGIFPLFRGKINVFGHRACLQVKGTNLLFWKNLTIQEKPQFC